MKDMPEKCRTASSQVPDSIKCDKAITDSTDY
jgi:hypothetical protein